MIGQETSASRDESHQRFSSFLRENSDPEQIVWVDNKTWSGAECPLWVRTRSPQERRIGLARDTLTE
jgi:hypothetical protein